jgi:hypothetical protein
MQTRDGMNLLNELYSRPSVFSFSGLCVTQGTAVRKTAERADSCQSTPVHAVKSVSEPRSLAHVCLGEFRSPDSNRSLEPLARSAVRLANDIRQCAPQDFR